MKIKERYFMYKELASGWHLYWLFFWSLVNDFRVLVACKLAGVEVLIVNAHIKGMIVIPPRTRAKVSGCLIECPSEK